MWCYLVADIETGEEFLLFDELVEHLGLNENPFYDPDAFKAYRNVDYRCKYNALPRYERPCLCGKNINKLVAMVGWDLRRSGTNKKLAFILPPLSKSIMAFRGG